MLEIAQKIGREKSIQVRYNILLWEATKIITKSLVPPYFQHVLTSNSLAQKYFEILQDSLLGLI